MAQRLLILDAHNYVFRAYFALKQGGAGGRSVDMSTSYGLPTGALYVYTSMLLRIYVDEKPDLVAVIFDSGGKTFRHEMDVEYKATRTEAPDELKPQFPFFDKLSRAFHVQTVHAQGVEADDAIATLTRRARDAGLDVVIYSGDKDLMQLIDDAGHVSVVSRGRDGEDRVFDAARVMEKFGVPPPQIPEWLALRGDTVDNIPGMAGIGDVTATQLLREFGSIDAILAAVDSGQPIPKDKMKPAVLNKFRDPEQRANLERSRQLVALKFDVPEVLAAKLDDFRRRDWDTGELVALFDELEFKSLIDRVEATFVTDPSKYRTITGAAELAELLAACRAAGEMAVATQTTDPDATRAALIGVAVVAPGVPAAYIPVAHRHLGAPAQLSEQAVLAALGPLLADAAFPKHIHNSKDEWLLFSRHGIELEGVRCDTALASYLLDSAHPEHELHQVAKNVLGHACIPLASVCGKGKEKKPLDEVDLVGATPYAAECADVTLKLGAVLRKRLDNAALAPFLDDLEQPLSRVLAIMQRHGVRVNSDVLRELGRRMGEDIDRLTAKIQQLAGYPVNPASPKQLGELLFDPDRLGLRSDRMRRTKTGAYSTDAEQLEELVDQHPIVAPIIEHRELFKLKTTYLDALPSLVNPRTGRLHTSYSQTAATTGRLASTNPNLQNIPIRTELGREIRRAFVAEPGWKLVSADYSQIELRVLAHLCGDPVLLDAFARDLDVHAQTAAEVFGVPLDQVSGEMRRVAKAVNYGLGYGQTDFGLSRALDIPREQARKYIDTYFHRFARVREYMEGVIAEARLAGTVKTILGRKLPIPGIKSSRAQDRGAAERFARNAPIQGSAAEILKKAMLRLQRLIDAGGPAGSARMLLTVHDELVFEVPAGEAEAFAALARREMENAHDLAVPLKVDVGIADSWADAH